MGTKDNPERRSLQHTIEKYSRASTDPWYRGHLSRRLHLDHYSDSTLQEHFRRNAEQMQHAYDSGLYTKRRK